MQLCTGPVVIIVAIINLVIIIGPAVLAGVAVLLLFVPLTAVFGKKLQTATVKKLYHSDRRTRVSTEVIQGMRVVKS